MLSFFGDDLFASQCQLAFTSFLSLLLPLSLSLFLSRSPTESLYSRRDKQGQDGERGNPKYPGVGACRASESAGSYIQAQLRVICSPGCVIPVERSPTRLKPPPRSETGSRFLAESGDSGIRSLLFVRGRQSSKTIGVGSFSSDRVIERSRFLLYIVESTLLELRYLKIKTLFVCR